MDTSAPLIVAFIVRVNVSVDPGLTGTVERVRTGERHRFEGPEALGRIIHRAVETERRAPDDAGTHDTALHRSDEA